MKLKRILALPFALVADIVSLGNMGDRSFTQQVFDEERNEQERAALAKCLADLIRAAKEAKHGE